LCLALDQTLNSCEHLSKSNKMAKYARCVVKESIRA